MPSHGGIYHHTEFTRAAYIRNYTRMKFSPIENCKNYYNGEY